MMDDDQIISTYMSQAWDLINGSSLIDYPQAGPL